MLLSARRAPGGSTAADTIHIIISDRCYKSDSEAGTGETKQRGRKEGGQPQLVQQPLPLPGAQCVAMQPQAQPAAPGRRRSRQAAVHCIAQAAALYCAVGGLCVTRRGRIEHAKERKVELRLTQPLSHTYNQTLSSCTASYAADAPRAGPHAAASPSPPLASAMQLAKPSVSSFLSRSLPAASGWTDWGAGMVCCSEADREEKARRRRMPASCGCHAAVCRCAPASCLGEQRAPCNCGSGGTNSQRQVWEVLKACTHQ